MPDYGVEQGGSKFTEKKISVMAKFRILQIAPTTEVPDIQWTDDRRALQHS